MDGQTGGQVSEDGHTASGCLGRRLGIWVGIRVGGCSGGHTFRRVGGQLFSWLGVRAGGYFGGRHSCMRAFVQVGFRLIGLAGGHSVRHSSRQVGGQAFVQAYMPSGV